MEYGFEFLALVLFIVVLAAGLEVWTRMSEAGRNIMATLDSPPVKSDEQMVAEELALEKRQHLEALDAYNEACNMEPFCGEGKRLTEKEKREELASLSLPGWANTPEHLRADPYTRMGP